MIVAVTPTKVSTKLVKPPSCVMPDLMESVGLKSASRFAISFPEKILVNTSALKIRKDPIKNDCKNRFSCWIVSSFSAPRIKLNPDIPPTTSITPRTMASK